MIKPIMMDKDFLSVPSREAVRKDSIIAEDLLETLKANRAACVGMAANMIGESVRIIAFLDGENYTVMYNPIILKGKDGYTAKEGCLSLLGQRETKRYQSIKVQYQNEDFALRMKTYSGFTAQIIQHEIDHCNGILI